MYSIELIINFDNNATTQIENRVLDAMLPYFIENYGNSNSIHQLGISANEAVKIARNQVANLIGAVDNEIIFTSGSTEAINIAIKGIAENYCDKGKHIVTVTTEHHAVLNTCKFLEHRGFEVTYLPVDAGGLINLEELRNAVRKDTILVCVMFVNNETGVLQRVKEIARIAHDANTFFMTDATQAIGKIDVDVDDLGIDLMCMSGHKMYAPKGIGALFISGGNRSIKLSPLIHGGGHEKGLRSGTLNVPGIVAIGKTCELLNGEMNQIAKQVCLLRDKLEYELLKIPGAKINGCNEARIFNVSNICFKGVDASILIGKMKNIAVSNGSACSSSVVEPSHVLKAMGLSDDDAFSSLRFSLGKYNTEKDVEKVVKRIKEII